MGRSIRCLQRMTENRGPRKKKKIVRMHQKRYSLCFSLNRSKTYANSGIPFFFFFQSGISEFTRCEIRVRENSAPPPRSLTGTLSVLRNTARARTRPTARIILKCSVWLYRVVPEFPYFRSSLYNIFRIKIPFFFIFVIIFYILCRCQHDTSEINNRMFRTTLSSR